MSKQLRLRCRWRWLAAVTAAAITAAVMTGCGSSVSHARKTSERRTTTGQITFYLSLPARANSLVSDAAAAAVPRSRHYRRFSSVRSLAARYGASSRNTRAVVSDVEKMGLRVAIDPSRLFARVSGTAGEWASALKAPLSERRATRSNPFDTYSLPSREPAGLPPSGTTWLFEQTTVYDDSASGHGSATSALTAPIIGLIGDRPAAKRWPKNMGTHGSGSCNQHAITAGEVYTPSQVQAAYGLTGLATRTGSAQPTIDVVDLGGGWNPTDLRAAGACFGYGSVHVSQVQGDGVPASIAGTDPETSLDLQTTAAVAPKASIRLIQASNGDAAMLDGFSRALANPPDVMTLSYGGCAVADAVAASTFVHITDEVLAMLAESGTSTFIAAGDSGSTTCPGPGVIPTESFPAVSSVVTAVGGTRLTLNAQNHRVNEVVWNDTEYGQHAAGGGALSLGEPRPPYQDHVNSTSTRAVPDVSALAAIKPGWPVFIDGKLETVGGTSGSSPFIAAATALVDAQQRSRRAPRVGLANGWFYQVAQHDPASFYDVTHGNNRIDLVNCCAATEGYDLASGLGVPNWSVLPTDLPAPARWRTWHRSRVARSS